MRQALPRVPKDRIAVLIGAKGVTAKSLRNSAGCKELNIDSVTGEVEVLWGEAGSYDPVKAMKLPNVIKAIGKNLYDILRNWIITEVYPSKTHFPHYTI